MHIIICTHPQRAHHVGNKRGAVSPVASSIRLLTLCFTPAYGLDSKSHEQYRAHTRLSSLTCSSLKKHSYQVEDDPRRYKLFESGGRGHRLRTRHGYWTACGTGQNIHEVLVQDWYRKVEEAHADEQQQACEGTHLEHGRLGPVVGRAQRQSSNE